MAGDRVSSDGPRPSRRRGRTVALLAALMGGLLLTGVVARARRGRSRPPQPTRPTLATPAREVGPRTTTSWPPPSPRGRVSVRRWSTDHVFQLWTLPKRDRSAISLGLAVGGTGATAFLLAYLSRNAGSRLNPNLAAHQTLHLAATVAAYLATGVGTVMLVAARVGHRRARRWYVLGGIVPALILVVALVILAPAPGAPNGLGLVFNAPVWIALGLLLASWLATGGSRLAGAHARVWILTLAFCAPLVSLLALNLRQRDPVLLAFRMDGLVLTFAFLAFPIAIGLLVLLGVEGLKLSSELGVWTLRMTRSAGRLLSGLVAAKLAVLVALAGYYAATLPFGLRSIQLTWPDVLCGIVLTLVVCWLLTYETRLGLQHADLGVAARGLGLIMAAIFIAVVVVGGLVVAYSVTHLPALSISLPSFITLAALAGLIGTRLRSQAAQWAGGIVGLVLTGIALIPYATTDRSHGVAIPQVQLTKTDQALLAGYAIAVLAVGAVFVLASRRLRPYRVFVIAVLSWALICLAAPTLVPGQLRYASTTVDLGLTAAVVLIALAHRRGRLLAISNEELVLLLITVTVVLEVPIIVQAIPGRWQSITTVLAFLTPALAALTIESDSLNARHPRRVSLVLGTVGAIAISYGTLYVLTDKTDLGLAVVQGLANLVTGLLALPFAIVLVAVTSNRLQPGQLVDRDTRAAPALSR